MAVTVESIDAAITSIQENGQSFTLDGVTYNAATLSTLYDYRQQLQNEARRTDGTRTLIRGFSFNSMGY